MGSGFVTFIDVFNWMGKRSYSPSLSLLVLFIYNFISLSSICIPFYHAISSMKLLIYKPIFMCIFLCLFRTKIAKAVPLHTRRRLGGEV
jgi:hypothetical protein